jgi:hypothetical protein
MHMLGVVIVGKRKREIGIEPAVVEMAALLAFADIDHWSTSRFDRGIILVITTIVKRLFCVAPGRPNCAGFVLTTARSGWSYRYLRPIPDWLSLV